MINAARASAPLRSRGIRPDSAITGSRPHSPAVVNKRGEGRQPDHDRKQGFHEIPGLSGEEGHFLNGAVDRWRATLRLGLRSSGKKLFLPARRGIKPPQLFAQFSPVMPVFESFETGARQTRALTGRGVVCRGMEWCFHSLVLEFYMQLNWSLLNIKKLRLD